MRWPLRWIVAPVAGALMGALVAPHLFSEFASVRDKVIRTPTPATDAVFRVAVPAQSAAGGLRTPFAAISRVRNDGPVPFVVRVAADDREICAAEIPAGRSVRLDCVVRGPWAADADHSLLFTATSSRFTVESLELATHFGAITPGPRNLIIGPAGFSASQPSSAWHVLAIVVLLTLSVWSVRHPRLPATVSAIHLAIAAVVALVCAAVVFSAFVSDFALLISDGFLERLLLLTAFPAIVTIAYATLTHLARPAARPLIKAVTVGLIVGAAFQSVSDYQVAVRSGGKASGQLWISEQRFDRSPLRNESALRDSLRLHDGPGYDGQFFYFMALDPWLVVNRDRPWRYEAFIDTPPYRYGRIGFSALTRWFSGGHADRFPETMIAIVIAALALCATLLSLIAQHHGWSAWWGSLIAVIPGFWQSVTWTLPEPLAAAFVLAAYLCLIQGRWWACGAMLGLGMLVRETEGVFVLAFAGGLLFSARRREAAIVSVLAFVPVVLWKSFVGWVFWGRYGTDVILPHPDDVGLPLAGVWQMWTLIARGEYFDGSTVLARAGISYSILSTAGVAMALTLAVKRPSAVAVAAAGYAMLAITFNYESVWLNIGNAERLTVDLFLALALVCLQPSPPPRVLPRATTLFWGATACYVFALTFDASVIRAGLFFGTF